MRSILRRFKKSEATRADPSSALGGQTTLPPFEPMLKFIQTHGAESLLKQSSVGGGQEVSPGMIQMPYVILSNAQDAFRDAACEWVTEANYMKWSDAGRGAAIVQGEPGSIEDATVEELQLLLTAKLRADRFCEGAFAGFCESGDAGRVLKRITVLAQARGA